MLMMYPDEDGEVLPLVANAKTAVVQSAIAIAVPAAAWAVSAFSFVFEDLPTTIVGLAEDVGLIPVTSNVPRTVWTLLFFPLEVINVRNSDANGRLGRYDIDAIPNGCHQLLEPTEVYTLFFRVIWSAVSSKSFVCLLFQEGQSDSY